jgi:Ca2+/H+ antiporter, TMEM165/GDT1 family
MINLTAAATAFAVIFPVELPDKTFIASLVLSTRYRPPLVWIGVVAAFLVQTAVAVLAGGVISLLPRLLVLAVAAVMFAVGAFLLLRGAGRADAEAAEERVEMGASLSDNTSTRRAVTTSFLVLFAAEWGDLSQLFTAGLVARGGDPVSVFLGSWLALATVAAIAVAAGAALLRLIRLSTIRRIGGGICAVLALLTTVEALRAA